MFGLPETSWIWLPEQPDRDKAQLALFRRSFTLTETPESAKIRISADTRYKLYVNGSLASLGPAKGDATVWFVDTVDLAPWLRAGKNVLAVEVLHYPRNGQTNQSLYHSATPGLFVEDAAPDAAGEYGLFDEIPANPLAVLYAPKAPRGLDLKTDARWKCTLQSGFSIVTENPFFGPLQILENTTALPELHGWKTPDYDDSAWKNAVPYDILQMKAGISPSNLVPRTIPAMRYEPRRFEGVFGASRAAPDAEDWNRLLAGRGSVTIAAHTKGSVELSADAETTGFLRLSVLGGTGAKLRILTSECYVAETGKDLIATNKKADRTDWEHGTLAGFTDTWCPAGTGSEALPECYEPFWFRTFRFVRLEVETGDAPLTLVDFDYAETGYPLAAATEIKTSDESFRDIWDISLRSLRLCMQETYTDCPFYEQLQYLMDSRSQMLFSYAVSADDRLARQCIELFSHAQRPDGVLNSSYPNTECNVIPGFSIFYILMVYDHMLYFGDKSFTRKYLGCMDGILHYFEAHQTANGLVAPLGSVNMSGKYWSFIDWSPAWSNYSGMPPAGLVGPLTAENLLYVLGLQKAAEVNDWLGRRDTAAEYRARAAEVQSAVNALCRDAEGVYLDGPNVPQYSVHSQILAILTDTVSAGEGKALLACAMDDPEKYATCSIAMYYYLFRALEKVGLYERTDELWNLWRTMLKKHLTTCVENDTSERSDCHAWGALALYELPSVILGVRPAAPGYAAIAVRPVPGTLTSAEGNVITPRGTVTVRWQKRPDGSLNLHYTAPEGVTVLTEGSN